MVDQAIASRFRWGVSLSMFTLSLILGVLGVYLKVKEGDLMMGVLVSAAAAAGFLTSVWIALRIIEKRRRP